MSPSLEEEALSAWSSRWIAADAPDVSARFRPSKPLDLGLTLMAFGSGPSQKVRGQEVWRATLTPHGPATLHLHNSENAVVVEAWGPGASWAAQHATELCGETDDDSGFQPAHRALASARHRHPGLRMPRSLGVFEALVPTVIGQKVPTDAAHHSYRSLVMALGTPAPGSFPMRVPPAAEVLARTPYWTFHRFGIERRRAEVIIRAARSAKRLEETASMDLASARSRLEAFAGVGPWTAAKVAQVALGDADAVPIGDYHLPHMVGFAFDGTPRSTDERMLQLLEPYRGHRARVIRLLMLEGVSAPRFGPRMTLRDITGS